MTFLYPTASTTAIFINGLHVEQAYQVQYKESINKIPIYGYSDYYYSKIAVGRALVQGILVLNFISPNYLGSVIKELSSPSSVPSKLYNYGFSKRGDSAKSKFIEDLKKELKTELPAIGGSYGADQEAESRKARAEYLVSAMSFFTSDAKKAMFDFFINQSTTAGSVNSTTVNGNTVPILSNHYESPLAYGDPREGITLDIYYQDPNLSVNWVRFEKVHFYETSQTISQAGAEGSSDPLYEIYPWIASKKIIKTVITNG